MRVFGNVLLLATLLALGLSAWFAPRVRDAAPGIDTSALVVADPMERGRKGEAWEALGVALSGYREVLAERPGEPEATKGLLRAATRLGASALGYRGLSQQLLEAFELYVRHRETADPGGEALAEAVDRFVDIRARHKWYVGRAALAMFLIGKGDARGREILDDLSAQADLWKEWFPFVQRNLPAWDGLAPVLRTFLEHKKPGARIYAAVTLMTYRRLWGAGGDLWERYRDEIGETLLRAHAAMTPNEYETHPTSPGGMTLLGLALYGTPETRRIVAELRPIDHPYLARTVVLAKLWAGLTPFSEIDFQDKRYEAWYELEREAYYRGALLRYAELVGAGDMEEARKLLEGPIADAIVTGADYVRIGMRRGLAAVHPDRSEEIHRALYDAGAVQRVYGVFGLPGVDRVAALLPALSAPGPDVSGLAAVGLMPPRDRSPIQMPKEN